MQKRDDALKVGILPATTVEPSALLAVAPRACEREIVALVAPAVRARDDVLEGRARDREPFGREAQLAAAMNAVAAQNRSRCGRETLERRVGRGCPQQSASQNFLQDADSVDSRSGGNSGRVLARH